MIDKQPIRESLRSWPLGPWAAIRKAWTLVLVVFVATVSAALAEGEESYELINGSVVSPLEIFQECDVCPEMIVLPMGSFMMGAPPEQSAEIDFRPNLPENTIRGRTSEGPVHKVVIDIPFAIGRNELTHDEWMVCVNQGGCSHIPDRTVLTEDGPITTIGRSPVMDVSYVDILEYVRWLNSNVGEAVYRLPTEAEWEYAARAGTDTPYAQGEELTKEQANYSGSGDGTGDSIRPDPTDHKSPISVFDLDAANPWGVRHMSGNVLERTMSCWSERHLGLATSSQHLDAFSEIDSCDRVSKGGAFAASMSYARPAARGVADQERRTDLTGFRLIRELR